LGRVVSHAVPHKQWTARREASPSIADPPVTRSRDALLLLQKAWVWLRDGKAIVLDKLGSIRRLRRSKKDCFRSPWRGAPTQGSLLNSKEEHNMKTWTKPAVREQEVGLEVTSYLPAEIDLI
jgi:coenzyme PQQ precursor peptide PqqA